MFPIVKRVDSISGGANARNWPGLVHLKRGIKYPAAVLAQEAWESMHKMDPVKLLFRVFKRSDDYKCEFEYMGHECEVQAARIIYGVEPASYRLAEAKRLQRGYDGLFKKMSVALIESEMRERSEKAERFVRNNISNLRKHK